MIGYLQILFKMFVLLGLIPQAPAPVDDALTWLEARTARRLLAPCRFVVVVEDPQRAFDRSTRRVIWFPEFQIHPRGAGWWGLRMNGERLHFEGLYIPYRGRLVHFPVLFTYGGREPARSPFPFSLEEFARE